MALSVAGRIESGVPVLAVNYDPEELFKQDAGDQLGQRMVTEYQALQTPAVVPSCIVEIKADVAGSPVVKGLFKLWQEVAAKRRGQVVCVGYPDDYLHSLTALGLPALTGFSLAGTVNDAVRRIAPS